MTSNKRKAKPKKQTGQKLARGIGVLTSGGDAQGMNAAVRAIVRKTIHDGMVPYGIRGGYDGLVKMVEQDNSREEEDRPFREYIGRDVGNILHLGGTILGSGRCEKFEENARLRMKIANELRKKGIYGLIVIGGDGSLTGAKILNSETGFPIVGIPASIDNDINNTDYSLGFQTAVNCCTEMITHLRQSASAFRRLLVIEVMGRDSGRIALAVGIASGAEKILLPECERIKHQEYSITANLEGIIDDLENSFEEKKRQSIIVVAEGCFIKEAAHTVQRLVEKHLSWQVRENVIGYIQRGAPPIAADIMLGTQFGVKAVETLVEVIQNGGTGAKNSGAVMTVFCKGEVGIVEIPKQREITRSEIDFKQLKMAMELA